MNIETLLIANRGEIAVRIIRAAAELGIRTVAVHSADDGRSGHLRHADRACALPGKGPAAYLDSERIIGIAKREGCDAIHPGYGFLSENADFARHCRTAELIFIGPAPEILDLFGNKAEARALATRCGVPLLPGTLHAVTVDEAKAFYTSLGEGAAVMIKAVSGGGGRGMRAVYDLSDIEEAYDRCRSEARAACGSDAVYIEALIRKPRHVEVQIVGDGDRVIHLGDRDCTMQRRHQKLIEVAPCPVLSPELREKITDAALQMARTVRFKSLGTFEFLVDTTVGAPETFAFMEVNPRLQVEHTVTEEVTGIDLVRTQIRIASGMSLAECGLTENAPPSARYALQLRINAETMDERGAVRPDAGTLVRYEVPTGPGIRVDGYACSGDTTHPAFDSLLAKLIVTSRASHFEDAVAKARRALSEFRIDGIATNIILLQHLLARPEVAQGRYHTGTIEDHAAELVQAVARSTREARPGEDRNNAFQAEPPTDTTPDPEAPEGTIPVPSRIHGRVVEIRVVPGDAVALGQVVAIVEAMKMEHVVTAEESGYVRAVCAETDDVIREGAPLFYLDAAAVDGPAADSEAAADLDAIRSDLAEVMARHAACLDGNRPEAVAKRRSKNQRTARENVQDLCDPGSFMEYGALMVAAQRKKFSVEELVKKSPADGLVAGVGSVNGDLFGRKKSRCLVMAYDYTVFAGTQGLMNHKKLDRMLDVAHQWALPTVLFAEGGGGRPSDTDGSIVAGLDLPSFRRFAGLSGKVPLVGIVSGPCFAGNAALLGCCDAIIAAEDANIGMGGPAMIEGGGLGVTRPTDIGPTDVQKRNGVVDIVVADEAGAVAVAKQYLAYCQGMISDWEGSDPRRLRRAIPENRLRVYDMRAVIGILADDGSVLELRRHFGPGMITAFIRIEGRPFGVMANNPMHMGGAIEAEAADKAARFMQLCDAYDLPILSLCDTPGFMVGPEVEARAQVRHACRMFVVGSHLHVPLFTVVLRKGYGLGAMAMSAGSFHSAFFTAAWPSGEFGAMGLEGAVKHAFRKELAAMEDPGERDQFFKSLVDMAYDMGKAINTASFLEIDAVIDPADTRRWILQGLDSVPESFRKGESRGFIDTW